jgi:hypothetical protein
MRMKRRAEIKGAILSISVSIFILTIILISLIIVTECTCNENEWNNGICSCGGSYYFKAFEPVLSTNQTKYWYECENCRDMIYQTHMR